MPVFDRPVAEGERGAVHVHHRNARRQAENARGAGRGRTGARALDGTNHGDAEGRLVQLVDRPAAVAQALFRQALEQRRPQHDPVVDDGATLQTQAVLDLDHRLAGPDLQRRGREFVGPGPFERHQIHLRMFAQAVAALDVEELEQEAALVVRRHVGAAALAAHHDVLCTELVDGLAQRADRNAECPREYGLARQRGTGCERAGLDRAEQRALDGAIERHAGSVGCDCRENRVDGMAAHHGADSIDRTI